MLIKFAFDQYGEEICILPNEDDDLVDIESMSDQEILQRYSLVTLSEKYSEFLYSLILGEQISKHIKYSAFEALVGLHSIQRDEANSTELFTKSKDKLLLACLVALDTINHPSSILKVAFILPKIAVEDQVGLSIKLISMVH